MHPPRLTSDMPLSLPHNISAHNNYIKTFKLIILLLLLNLFTNNPKQKIKDKNKRKPLFTLDIYIWLECTHVYCMGLLDGPESKHIYIDINHSQVDTPQFLFKSLVVYGSGP